MRTGKMVLGLAAAGLSFLNSAGATPISASMSLLATAEIQNSAFGSDFDAQAWGTLLAPLSVSAAANATDENGESANATGEGRATWGAGGNSGSVAFTNYGWVVSPNLVSSSATVTLYLSPPDWAYTFIADADGTFAMSYDVTATGENLFGLQGWDIGWSGPGAGLSLMDVFDPAASGTFTRSVVAGQTYSVVLTNGANVGGGIMGFDAHMRGDFDFTITPRAAVPEPETLALLSLGLAGLGFSRRKQ